MTIVDLNYSFLIADDEGFYRKRIKKTLEGCGYTEWQGCVYYEAPDGIAAVKMVKSRRPGELSLVTMDRKMPTLVDGEHVITEGEQAIREIRKHDARVPVIMVTSAIPVPKGGTLDGYLRGLGANVYYVNKGELEKELPGLVNRILLGEAC